MSGGTSGGGSEFQCPSCGEMTKSRVIDARVVRGKKRRRRECMGCGARFTTFESVWERSLSDNQKKRAAQGKRALARKREDIGEDVGDRLLEMAR